MAQINESTYGFAMDNAQAGQKASAGSGAGVQFRLAAHQEAKGVISLSITVGLSTILREFAKFRKKRLFLASFFSAFFAETCQEGRG